MIKFMVDSASDCRKEDGLYDYFVPMAVSIGDREYLDGVDLDCDTFYELLTGGKDFPKTSQPSPQNFLEYFERVKEDDDELICFCISSALSGTYQSAVMAKEMAGYDKIHVIDTKTATHMIGVLVEQAGKLRAQGCTAEQIVEAVEELKSRVKVLAGLDTLEYLRRGGRLSNASAVVGGLAQIKPTVTVTEEGKVEVQSKAIGKARAMQQIVEKLRELELDSEFDIWPVYTCGEENCEIMEQRLREAGFRVGKRRQVGATIGAHIGPGVYGVMFVTK